MGADGVDRGERLPSFGTWLARERELRGLSRDEVIRATRIAPAVVEALEAGEAARMPPRAYALGYLRAYAAALGLDADEVVLRYEEAAGSADAEVRGAQRRRSQRRMSLLALAAAVALAIAGLVAWGLLRG